MARIALDSHPILKRKTGVGWYAYNIITELSKSDSQHAYSLIAFDFLGRNESEQELSKFKSLQSQINRILPYKLYKILWGCYSDSIQLSI